MRVLLSDPVVGTFGICGRCMGTYGWKDMQRLNFRSENQGLTSRLNQGLREENNKVKDYELKRYI